MRKTIFLTACVIYGCYFFTGCKIFKAEKKSPLSMPHSPFIKKQESRAGKNFEAEIKDDSISFGNKTLQACSNGRIKLYYGAKKPVSVLFNVKTDFGWLAAGGKNFMTKKFEYDRDNKAFKYIGSFPLTKNKKISGTYKQNVKLLPNGLIKINASFSLPEGATKNIESGKLYLSWPGAEKGEKVLAGNKTLTVLRKNPPANWWFLNTTKTENIEFFPGKPEKSLIIRPEKFSRLLASTGKNLRVAITPTKEKQLSVLLDIREAVLSEKSPHTYAGIDFMAIENLEMPDYKSSKNLIQNPSFEQGLRDIKLFPRGAGRVMPGKHKWVPNFVLDEKVSKSGKYSLRVKTFPPLAEKRFRHAYVISTAIPLAPGTYTLSFYAKGDRPGKQTLRVGRKYCHPGKNWKRYTQTFKIKKSRPYHYTSFANSSTGDGNVWIDDIQLEKNDKATAFETRPVQGRLTTSDPGNFIKNGDKINAELEIISTPGASGKAEITVKDFFSKKLFTKEYDFKCAADGRTKIKLPFEDKFPRGIFVVKANYTLNNGKKTYDFFRFSIMDFLENKHRLKNIFSSTYCDNAGMPNFEKILKRWKKIGIGSRTYAQSWRKDCFDALKKYGIKNMDACMASRVINNPLEGYRLHIHPDDSSGKYLRDFRYEAKDPDARLTDEYLARFQKAVEKNARTAPWVKIWKLAAEQAISKKRMGRYNLKIEDYLKLLKAFQKGVKAGNPEAGILQGGPCNMSPANGIRDVECTLELTKNKVKFDVIGIHTYRARPEEPDMDSDTKALFKVLKKYGYENTPVYWPEGMHWGPYTIPKWEFRSASWTPPACWYYGPLSYDMGWSEKVSAAWRARAWLVALKYQDRIQCFTSGDFMNNFEMDLDLTPFATQKIPNTLGRLLGDARFKKDIRFAPYVRCYIFEDEKKRPVAAVWGWHSKLDAGTISPFTAEVDFGKQAPKVFDLMEAEHTVSPGPSGKIEFPVSSFPLFFRGKPGTLAGFIKAFNNASLLDAAGFAPINITGQPSSPKSMNIIVKNSLSRPFKGRITVNGRKSTLSVPSAGKKKINVSLPHELRADKIVSEQINGSVENFRTKKKFPLDCDFNGFIAMKTQKDMIPDGNIEKWKDIPAIKMKNRTFHGKKRKIVSDNDFSGWFKVAWNENGLYLCVKITDDQFINRKFKRLHDYWNNDSLQVYFDTLCDARQRQTKGYDLNDYDYGIFPDKNGETSFTYRYRSPDPQLTVGAGAPEDGKKAENIKTAFRKTANGYIYEVAFPPVSILPIALKKGTATGFSLFINDCDDAKSDVESSMTLTPPETGCYNNPHLWPIMLLW